MESPKPTVVVLQFIEGVNAADVTARCSLMTADHIFIDGLGTRFQGSEKRRAGWKSHFACFPD